MQPHESPQAPSANNSEKPFPHTLSNVATVWPIRSLEALLATDETLTEKNSFPDDFASTQKPQLPKENVNSLRFLNVHKEGRKT